jgi:hypothetical protein
MVVNDRQYEMISTEMHFMRTAGYTTLWTEEEIMTELQISQVTEFIAYSRNEISTVDTTYI